MGRRQAADELTMCETGPCRRRLGSTGRGETPERLLVDAGLGEGGERVKRRRCRGDGESGGRGGMGTCGCGGTLMIEQPRGAHG